jgi:hypothetical protein
MDPRQVGLILSLYCQLGDKSLLMDMPKTLTLLERANPDGVSGITVRF